MKKFAVFSGFLGSGKTSTMMALTEYHSRAHGKAAMITNDLGGEGLADKRFASLRGCSSTEITGDCICYQNEKLAEHLDGLFSEGCELVISDIPGFGVGALEHVYHGLEEKFPGRYTLAPFTVLVEPKTVALLRDGFNEDLYYILHTQLVEADLIVLNKCDLLSDEEKAAMSQWLRSRYPQAELVCISATRGENLEALSQALIQGRASMQRPDIGYGGGDFTRIMEQVMEFNLQYYATVCCNSFDANAYLLALAERIQAEVAAIPGALMPHLKLLAWEPEGEYGKLDILGTDRAVEVNQRFTRPSTELAVVINSSAFCPGIGVEQAIMDAVEEISGEYQLDLMIFRKEKI